MRAARKGAVELLGIPLGVVLVTSVRLVVPLVIFRYPFWGGVAAIVLDAVDVILIYLMDLGDFQNYHGTDKLLDSYFLVFMLICSLRKWAGLEKRISLTLFGWRMIGFVAFELTGLRWLLFVFPNLFLWWWMYVEWRNRYKPGLEITTTRAAIVLSLMIGPKLLQEAILHIWQFHPVQILQQFFIDVWHLITNWN